MNDQPQPIRVPVYRAEVRPATRLYKPPTWEGKAPIGKEEQHFTTVILRYRRPELNYPRRSLYFQLKNAAGSCFVRLTPEEITALVAQLTSWNEVASGLYKADEDLERKLRDSIRSLETEVFRGTGAKVVHQAVPVPPHDVNYGPVDDLAADFQSDDEVINYGDRT